MTMQGKQILARAILKSKRKLGVTTHFLETIIKQHYSKKQYLKIQSNLLRFFFQIQAFFSSEKCMVNPNFLFGYQEHLLNSAFSAQF